MLWLDILAAAVRIVLSKGCQGGQMSIQEDLIRLIDDDDKRVVGSPFAETRTTR